MEPPATLGDVPAFVDATAPAVETQVAKLRAIPRPDDDEGIDEYIAKVEETLLSAREVGAAAARGDAEAANAAGARTQELGEEARELARRLGAEECATQ